MRQSVSVKATYEGVLGLPWSLGMISTRSLCHTATRLLVQDQAVVNNQPPLELDRRTTYQLVVPRSIPITLPDIVMLTMKQDECT